MIFVGSASEYPVCAFALVTLKYLTLLNRNNKENNNENQALSLKCIWLRENRIVCAMHQIKCQNSSKSVNG